MSTRKIVGCTLLLLVVLPGLGTAQGVLFVEGDKVGIGVSSPTSVLHVLGTSGNAQFLLQEQSLTEAARTLIDLQNNGVAFFRVADTSPDGSGWTFQAEGPSFRFNKAGTGGAEVIVRSRNDGSGGLATFTVDGSLQADNVTFTSSKFSKQGFISINPRSILERIANLEISEWNFKDELNQRRHIGPMAEDFASVFGLGSNAAQISLIDATGVALAGIQGLYGFIQERNEEVELLTAQNTELQKRLEALEQAVQKLAAQ